MKIQHSVIINRPLEQVFAFVTNLENEMRWQPEIVSIQFTSDGPMGVGTTFQEVRRTFGRRYDWHFEVTEFELNKIFCIRTLSGTIHYQGCRLFEPISGGTKVTESGELQTPGLLKFFDPLLARLSQKPLAEAYNNLKFILEAQEIEI
ncbi:MAG TPA: SRPBCC family protein [Anaerolineae bacterium]|nr:SRPBCC family protein [Anaerolineae bacterium]